MFFNEKVFSPFLEEEFNLELHQIRPAVQYVAKFLALNLELDPPDCSNLGDDPEDVSGLFELTKHSNSCLYNCLTLSVFL